MSESLEICLTDYECKDKSVIIEWIAEFYGFHASMIHGMKDSGDEDYKEAEKTLRTWLVPGHELYIIRNGKKQVGFLHLGYRGSCVAWIEDIFIDKRFRGKGIAVTAIRMAEELIKLNQQYIAVCMDVVPRNEAALKLYHKLGYDSISIVTVRKEFYENKRDRVEKILGLDFKI